MRRDLLPRLTDAGLTIFWTALIGNEQQRGDHIPGDDYRWVSASASYMTESNKVELPRPDSGRGQGRSANSGGLQGVQRFSSRGAPDLVSHPEERESERSSALSAGRDPQEA
jgi:hypothetical protein